MLLLFLGESGLGKSTLLNSLFLTDLYTAATFPTTEEKLAKTTEVQASTVTLEEGGVTLRLTCVDTPGFGDAVDNTDWYVHTMLYDFCNNCIPSLFIVIALCNSLKKCYYVVFYELSEGQ